MKIKELHKFCKINNIKCYHKLNKQQLFQKIKEWQSIIKIQKFFRKSLGFDICPITLIKPKYPYFYFKSKDHFTYYNIEDITNYLLCTSDFRDPKSREEFTINDIKKLNNKNLLKEFNNRLINLSLKKEKDEQILILERCLDEVCSSFRTMIEERHINNINEEIETYKDFLYQLNNISQNDSSRIIESNINDINTSTIKAFSTCKNPIEYLMIDKIRDFLVSHLYQIKFEMIF